jgi:hypothetical protein
MLSVIFLFVSFASTETFSLKFETAIIFEIELEAPIIKFAFYPKSAFIININFFFKFVF